MGLFPRRLPFTKSNVAIKTFRHAISLDEHRAKFKANLYQKVTAKEAKVAMHHKTAKHKKHSSKAILEDLAHVMKTGQDVDVDDDDKKRKALEEQYTDNSTDTDVQEVWFAGCHCGEARSAPTHTSCAGSHSLLLIRLRQTSEAGMS